ncbi:GNAT family N-acetyltransferase [Saccharibacillus brassicae]|uniref:GNAT family N-acetyltransferase n=1 Tax=Saccharibacillus brassicae TaxID=2583377 RepID=A0A4Y6UUW3_SACBS|nr:GNAT family N-acetyltransferase [Saccharibacillus brassicae]QDH21479.1 GNAT family N-acetyltransferase [Saccharibacillus brassicae]
MTEKENRADRPAHRAGTSAEPPAGTVPPNSQPADADHGLGADVIEVRRIAFGTAEYELALKLRDEVLRRPLGLSIADDDLSGEEAALHIGAFARRRGGAEARLVGTLLLRAAGEGALQMKQVAVDEALRGTGTGRQLVRFAEALAARQGYGEIVLHARETAAPFYDKLGYAREGERFEEIGIPHYSMRKPLGGAPE